MACASCKEPLTVEVELDDDDQGMTSTETVPDDVALQCGDHFHWQCLLDSIFELSKCPACNTDISSHTEDADQRQQKVMASVVNEGGVQPELDLFPILQEELYLKTFPEERKPRAFLEFCREGDYRAAVSVLRPDDDDDEEDPEAEGQQVKKPELDINAILRYRDPLADDQSALHAAVANGHREVAWLLLLLASSYPETEFPALVYQEAASLGIMRAEQEDMSDIREFRDAKGRTAEDIALQSGDTIWTGWTGNSRLAMP